MVTRSARALEAEATCEAGVLLGQAWALVTIGVEWTFHQGPIFSSEWRRRCGSRSPRLGLLGPGDERGLSEGREVSHR